MARKLTPEEFIQKAKAIHGEKYDYSEIIYGGVNGKSIIICPKHGRFHQRLSAHLLGQGCAKCNFSKLKQKNTLTLNRFISMANKVHHEKYDYSVSNYITGKHKNKIC